MVSPNNTRLSLQVQLALTLIMIVANSIQAEITSLSKDIKLMNNFYADKLSRHYGIAVVSALTAWAAGPRIARLFVTARSSTSMKSLTGIRVSRWLTFGILFGVGTGSKIWLMAFS
jgi:hypothetical protein